MALCRDSSLKFLNSKGYNVVRVPRAGIEPLDLLGRDDGEMAWLGRLDALWQSPAPFPPLLPAQPASDLEGKRTDNLELNAGLSLLKGVLQMLNAGAGLDAAYSHASTIEFSYTNVKSVSVAPIAIGAYLAQGSTDEHNPVIQRYFLSKKAKGFILTEVLKSNRLKVTAKNSHGESIKVDVDQISATLGANVGISVSQSTESSVVYEGEVPVTFGFRLLGIALVNGVWVTRGVKADGALAFDVSAEEPEPVALTEHTLLEIADTPSGD